MYTKFRWNIIIIVIFFVSFVNMCEEFFLTRSLLFCVLFWIVSSLIWFLSEMMLRFLLVSSADHLSKQFGPRSDQTKCWAWSGSKLFDTLMEILNEFFTEKFTWKKISLRQKSNQNFPVVKELKQ